MYAFLKIIFIFYLLELNIYGSSVKPLLINKNMQSKIFEIEKKYQFLKRSIFSPQNDNQTKIAYRRLGEDVMTVSCLILLWSFKLFFNTNISRMSALSSVP